MATLTVDGVDVHYVVHGERAAPRTAVLLHGFTPDHRLMTGCFEPVFASRAGWRRIYVDLPGMGLTPAPESIASTDDVFALVREVLDTLVSTGPYAVAGESYGGYLALGLASSDSDRVSGIALVCPMIVAEHAERDVPPHSVLVREAGLDVPDGSEFAAVAVVQTAETLRRTTDEIVVGLEIADEAALDRIRERFAGTFPLTPAGGEYEGPALFLTGRQDSSTGYRDAWRLSERYPHATFAVLDRAGHNAQIEQPAVFDVLVHEWLDRVESAST